MGFRNPGIAQLYDILFPNEGALYEMGEDQGGVGQPFGSTSFLYYWMPRAMTVSGFGICSSAAVGNCELAVYQSGVKKATTGTVAVPVAATPTRFNLATPVPINAGDSWLACGVSAAGTAWRTAYDGEVVPQGILKIGATAFPLPLAFDPETQAAEDTTTQAGLLGWSPWPSAQLYFAD
jgi:hypothetical protein